MSRTEQRPDLRPSGPKHRAQPADGARRGVLRGLALLLVLGVWLGVAGVGGPLVGRLSEVQENDNASFLPSTAESTEVSEVGADFNQSETLPFFLLIERDGGLTEADLAAAEQYAADLPTLPVPGGDGATVGDFLAPDQPVFPVPSEDGEAVLMLVPLDAGTVDQLLADGESAVFGVADALRTSLRDSVDEGATTAVGGPGGVLADLVTAFEGIDGRLLQVTLTVVFIILLLVYRSPVLPFVALLSAIFALAAAGLVVFPLAENGVIGLNGQSQGILFILVVGAATDYALLLISRYREELHDHPRPFDAMRVAWRASLEPIAASATTVALGLLCLLLSDLGSTRGLGPVGAIGIAAAMLSVLTLLPVLLLAGRWLFWPRIPRLDHVHRADAVGGRGVWGRVAGLVGRRPRAVWGLTVLVLGGLAAFAPTFQAEGTAQTDVFREEVESVVGTRILSEHFPGGSGNPTLVLVPEEQVDAAEDVVAGTDGVESVLVTQQQPAGGEGAGGPPPALGGDEGAAPPGAEPAAAEPLVVDGLVRLEVILTPAADTPAAENVVRDLRIALDEVTPDALVGGNTATNLDVREASGRDLRLIVPVVLLVVLVVLILLLRSIVAPLLLVVANLLSFAATIGVASLVFDNVLDLPGSDPGIPLYGFVFLVALGVDYSIFLMTRVREESFRRGTRPGILVGLAVTGGVITSAGVVLASTFSALATVPLLFLLQIAFIVAFGVLLDTLVVRSLLVPALSYDIGSRIWWPGALWREDVTEGRDADVDGAVDDGVDDGVGVRGGGGVEDAQVAAVPR